MFGKNCNSCSKKVRKNSNFCPNCGNSFNKPISREDFGVLGINDKSNGIQEEFKFPFGMDKMINSLVKQLEKQMNDANLENFEGAPRGFRINMSTGKPRQTNQIVQNKPKNIRPIKEIPQKETSRRNKLPKVEAESKVKRLGDKIIYEITMPNIISKDNVVITELASGLEVRGYSKNKCYVKFIPLRIEVLGYYLEREKLFLELKA